MNASKISAVILSLALTACGSNDMATSQSTSVGGGTSSGGTAGGTKITTTGVYSQPKQLGVGDVLYVDLNSSNSLDFAGVDSSAEFVFGLINSSASQGSLAVTMSGDLSDADLDLAKEMDSEEPEEDNAAYVANDVTESFHSFLRQEEKEFAISEPLPDDSLAGKSVSSASASASVSVGSQRSFKVLSSLSSTSSYAEVSATARCVGSNVIFYVDDAVTSDMLSDADIQSLCSGFDPVVVREENLFGDLSDVDGNGKIISLFTPQVNRLGASGGGIITGFFLGNDLYANSASNPASNYSEILYIMVPDPSGRFGTAVSRAFAMSNLLPSVLPHELQHAISYNEHVFVSRGNAENSCLNEGLSHIAEDLMGQGQENPSRYGLYLQSPQSYSIVSCSSAGLGSRGGTYLFLRYLYEQADNGDAFLKRLIQTNKTGIDNVEASFAGKQNDFDQFGEFFLRWSVAISGITQDSQFSFKARERDSQTSQWKGACVSCDAEDGRSTRLSGVSSSTYRGSQINSLRPAAVRFFKVAGLKDKMNFANDARTGEGYGVLIRSK